MIFGPAQVLAVTATAVDVTVYEGPAILHGWAWRETSETNRCELELTDGAGGPVIVPITLRAGGSTRDWLSGTGIYVRTGLYLNMLSGAVSASLWVRPLESHDMAAPLDVQTILDDLIETLWVR